MGEAARMGVVPHLDEPPLEGVKPSSPDLSV